MKVTLRAPDIPSKIGAEEGGFNTKVTVEELQNGLQSVIYDLLDHHPGLRHPWGRPSSKSQVTSAALSADGSFSRRKGKDTETFTWQEDQPLKTFEEDLEQQETIVKIIEAARPEQHEPSVVIDRTLDMESIVHPVLKGMLEETAEYDKEHSVGVSLRDLEADLKKKEAEVARLKSELRAKNPDILAAHESATKASKVTAARRPNQGKRQVSEIDSNSRRKPPEIQTR